MTKYLYIFLFSFIVGVGIAFGFSFWKKEKAVIVPKISPQEEKFSIDSPPKQSLKGIITSQSGQILWQSRVATEPAEINDLKQIQQAELLVTGKESNISINFKDAVAITLSSESEIEFLQTLPVNFVFRQNKGEINYVKKGSIPFSVRSMHLLMTFTDGEYLLNIDSENHTLELVVKKGLVKAAYNNIQYETQNIKIIEGEKFVFDDDSRTGEIK
jgi:hypothetical protein